ncbi:MAG: RdgB/HAM1 family non-canonical purine NTP pyrophosphatase [Alphaproteobacteria bacterium]|nr:RdgB/HAM1 family non-canonical purine NTP pyrophosphatase [Alphaproteobacteria bacterium]
MKLIIATNNQHKLDEIREILATAGLRGVEVLDLSAWPALSDLAEDHDSFVDNALQKARAVHAATGLPAVADDSGLECDGLDGAPGVRSKRFTPEATADANNAHLLERLADGADRTARFRCVLALVTDAGERTVDGRCEGRIAHAPRGDGGFGYDPLFLPDDHPGRSMAELSTAEKNAISHRGRAFSQLPALIAALGLA